MNKFRAYREKKMIAVHCKPNCVFCDKAFELLTRIGFEFMKIMYNPQEADYEQAKNGLISRTSHRTFPQIFVGDLFIGGYRELEIAYETGKLRDICAEYDF